MLLPRQPRLGPKPAQDSPYRREAVGRPIRAETRQRLSEAVCGALAANRQRRERHASLGAAPRQRSTALHPL
jgi:hypothetical protein